MPRSTRTASELERAGSAVAEELTQEGQVIDLRDTIDPALRVEAPPAPARGCPCGCGDTELLLRSRQGDAAAMHELLERYRKLARSKAQSYFLLGGDRDDVVQEGMIGVYKAIRDYDESHGVPFRNFAEVCVTRQILTAVKAATRMKHAPLTSSVSLDKPVSDEEGGACLADLLPAATSADPASAYASAEDLRALQRHFDEVLSDLEMQVLRHHMEGRSYDEIGAMLQRHAKSIDNALQRIRKKVQDHLDDRRADAV